MTTPDGSLRPQPDAAAVGQPQPPAFGVFRRNFQPFPPPHAVNPLHARVPALVEEQAADAPVAEAAIPCHQPHNPPGQSPFASPNLPLATLRCARLSDKRPRTALRNG